MKELIVFISITTIGFLYIVAILKMKNNIENGNEI